MSALGDALSGIRQILLLQDQVARLEKEVVTQQDDIEALATDVIAIDKRLVRIETMVELSMARDQGNPRLSDG